MSMIEQLQVNKSSLSVDLSKGAALTSLILDDVELIKPFSGYHFESSLLFPFPNRLSNGTFKFEGKEYVFHKNDLGRPNALHGIIHDMHFQIKQTSPTKLDLELDYTGDLDEFPFHFSFSIFYELQEEALTINVAVKNRGDVKFPFGFGWHPYFKLIDKSLTRLKLPTCEKVHVNENLIPTGRTTPYLDFNEKATLIGHELDHCLALLKDQNRHTTLLELDIGIDLELWQDGQFSFLQVFTPGDDLTLALEPMTCNVDALNTGDGLMVLDSGDSWSGAFGLRIMK